jgi:hypothetical protein
MRLNLTFITKFVGFALFVLLVVFLAGSLTDSLNDQVTFFPAKKTGPNEFMPLNRTVYKVFPDTHTVIYWRPGVADVPKKLAQCQVQDRLNWHCMYSDGSGDLVMNDGTLKITSGANQPEDNIENVGRVKWWLLHLGL